MKDKAKAKHVVKEDEKMPHKKKLDEEKKVVDKLVASSGDSKKQPRNKGRR
jgi:hypothetical protein